MASVMASGGRQAFWLSMHVGYRCRDSGVCCTSGWAIPVERQRVARISQIAPDAGWLVRDPTAPPDAGGVLAVSSAGRCVFHRSGCEIQRAFGHAALPSACQHFPREVLIDPRGVFVTLSHYCPTAADLLFDHTGPVDIVAGPPPLPEGEPEGLDARGVLPPLLDEGVLMDYEGYAAWERHVVRALTTDDGATAEAALARLDEDAAFVQGWRPGTLSLAEHIARVPPRAAATGCSSSAMVIRRYLAARAFASWMAYQGRGIVAVVGSLHLALAALRGRLASLASGSADPPRDVLKEAIRQADLQLVHLADRDALAEQASRYRLGAGW